MNKPSERIQAIFEASLALESDAQRAEYLNRACPEPALRRQVESLLAAHRNPDNIIDDETVRAETPPSEGVGTVIGRYKVLEALGEGGFGAVWLAEQKEPVRRKVALKVIKLGMDTRQVVARFEAERQALALMDHPNIAKVLDAGTTESGRPYFVMELVRGVPITKFCDENKLTTHERLDLFIKVCHAVQHAHQKGIIHRDLKPSNVLVTLHDGVPVPKVIDFGIAKATQQELTDKTLHTMFQQFIGTPAYVSPEQAEMSGLDIDTRSDIYSLGVLLYELLTGVTPFDGKELLASGIDQMRRTIREKEPVRPSTRLTQLQAASRGPQLAPRPSSLATDLDWIVMRCLEKDRTRRYETANGLAADLKRHLGNEPVVARPPSAAYQIQKFVRRNKTGVVAAALVTLLLVAGIIGTSLGFFRAEGERRRAVSAARDAQTAQREAQAARIAADENARELQTSLYFNRVSLAHRELTADAPNILDAVNLLSACPEDLRDWEWRYLNRLWLTEPIVLRNPSGKECFSASFSSDDRHLAVASGDGVVSIWNLGTRQLVKSVQASTGCVSCVAFHPRNPTLVASLGLDRQVKLWDWQAGTVVRYWPGDSSFEYGTAYAVAFSQDGRHLAAPSPGGFVKVWDTASGNEVVGLAGHETSATSVAFSPDGLRLATGSHGVVRVWDVGKSQLLMKFACKGPPISCVAFSPDGRRLAASSFDEWVRIWDATSFEMIQRFRPDYHLCIGMAFSADGRRLATGAMDRAVGIWDPLSGRQVLSYSDRQLDSMCVVFSRDGQRLASASRDGTVHVWDATPLPASGDGALTTLRHPGEIWAMRVSPDGQLLATGGIAPDSTESNCPVVLWDAQTGRRIRDLTGHRIIVFDAAFSPDSHRLATVGDEPAGLTPSAIKVWNLADGIEAPPVESPRIEGVLFCVTFSPDGRHLVAAGQNGSLLVWDVSNGRMINVLGTHQREVLSMRISPDGRYLASTSSDGEVKIWDATRLTEFQDTPRVLRAGRPEIAEVLAFTSDSARLMTGDLLRAAGIWDVATGNLVETIKDRSRAFQALASSPDGRWLASAGIDCTIRLWDARSLELRHTFRGHQGNITRLAFVQRSEGLCLVSGSRDQTVKFWNLAAVEK